MDICFSSHITPATNRNWRPDKPFTKLTTGPISKCCYLSFGELHPYSFYFNLSNSWTVNHFHVPLPKPALQSDFPLLLSETRRTSGPLWDEGCELGRRRGVTVLRAGPGSLLPTGDQSLWSDPAPHPICLGTLPWIMWFELELILPHCFNQSGHCRVWGTWKAPELQQISSSSCSILPSNSGWFSAQRMPCNSCARAELLGSPSLSCSRSHSDSNSIFPSAEERVPAAHSQKCCESC